MNNIEKLQHSSLKNLSNSLYGYFKKKSNGEIIRINDSFDFDEYKEVIRFDLVQFSYNFISLLNINSEKSQEIVREKAKLKNCVDDILDNEELLEKYTIYKIQQFINRVARNLLDSNFETFKEISKNEKYFEYKDIKIDSSRIIGFISTDKVISDLYREFNLKRVNNNEYLEVSLLKSTREVKQDPTYVDEIDKILFKAAVDIDDNNHVILNHPNKNDETIVRYLEDGCVAERTPKRVLRKVIEEEEIDFLS